MSKYDCNKTMDYGHEFRRLCNLYPSCSSNGGCPLKGLGCSAWGSITQKEIDILQKWSDEHPEPPKIRKRELDFIAMFKYPGEKRIDRTSLGRLRLVMRNASCDLCDAWFSFIGKDESMTFEELLKLEVEE